MYALWVVDLFREYDYQLANVLEVGEKPGLIVAYGKGLPVGERQPPPAQQRPAATKSFKRELFRNMSQLLKKKDAGTHVWSDSSEILLHLYCAWPCIFLNIFTTAMVANSVYTWPKCTRFFRV